MPCTNFPKPINPLIASSEKVNRLVKRSTILMISKLRLRISTGFSAGCFRSWDGVRLWIIALFWLIVGSAHSETFYDRHVVFDNGFAAPAYYRSEGMVVAPSKLEMLDGKCPVDQSHFLSPPNSLRLKWTSAPGGDWQMKLKPRVRYGRNFVFEGDRLSFWCYSETAMSPEESPRITL